MNQDGLDDLILSAPSDVNGPTIGHVYLIFGKAGGFSPDLDLGSLNGTTGYVFDGIGVGDGTGSYVNGAGDVNHDGIPDVVIGAGKASPSGDRIQAGQSYLIYGGGAHLAALDLADGVQDGRIALTSLNGTDGFTINGIQAGDLAGRVTGAGDVNGDHFDDLLVGASAARGHAGEAYVVFGGPSLPAALELSSLNGSNGFVIRSAGAADYVGNSVAGAGDVNHDGFADFVVGAAFASPAGRSLAGQAHVIFGKASFPAIFNLSSLNGSNGFTVNGGAASDYLGWSVSVAGDVNGDGNDDVLIGALNVDVAGVANAGTAYVIFGKTTTFPAALEVATLNGTNGFALRGSVTNGTVGNTVSGAGDVNGDSYDDLLVSAPYELSIPNAGRSYLVYGGPNFLAGFDLASLLTANSGDGSRGFALNGFEAYSVAWNVAGIGDINGDGFADIRIGAPGADPNRLNSAGQAFIVYGKPSPPATKFYVVNDATGDRTYEYTAAGNSNEDYALNNGNTAPRGAASTAVGDKVWVVDANKKVYVYNPGGGLLGSWTAGSLAGNATVEGITTNGTDIWIVDSEQAKVFRYTGAASRLSGSQNAASSFSLNSSNTTPKDVVTDDTSLWVVNDSTTDKVFKYNLSGSLLGSWTITGAGSSPTGINLDPSGGGNLWIVDSGTRRVYQFDNARGLTSGSLLPSTSFVLAAGNTNPQGIADPPTPSSRAPRSTSLTSPSRPPADPAAHHGMTIPSFWASRASRSHLAPTDARALIAAQQEPPILAPLSPPSDQDLTLLATDLIRADTKRTRTSTRS